MMALMGREIGIEHFVTVPFPMLMAKVLFPGPRSADADQMSTMEEDRCADPTKFTRAFGHASH